jgi:hypothetical protein
VVERRTCVACFVVGRFEAEREGRLTGIDEYDDAADGVEWSGVMTTVCRGV